MLALILLEALIVLNIIHCVKQRKFYKEYGKEMTGTVVSWEKMRSKGDRMNPIYYVLEVQTAEGMFHVESNNSKAKKYHEGSEVTLLIVPHSFLPELPPETLEGLTPEQLVALEQARIAETKTQELERKLTILKEDLKGVGEIVFCIIAGVFFGLLFVVEIVDRFI